MMVTLDEFHLEMIKVILNTFFLILNGSEFSIALVVVDVFRRLEEKVRQITVEN